MPNWLGDCIMALPALRHAVQAFPKARIHLAARQALRRLLGAQPGVTGFVEAPASGFGKFLGGMLDAKAALRRSGLTGGVDAGILFTNSFSTAAWLWRTGVKTRIGYNLDRRSIMLTHPVPCGGMEKSWHFTRYYLRLVQAAEAALRGQPLAAPENSHTANGALLPSLQIDETARAAAAGILKDAGITGPYAVLAPASAYGAVKDWPPEHYRRLTTLLNRDFSLATILTGGAGQKNVCAAIAASQEAAVNLAGKTRLEEFAAIMAGASLFIGGDSGGAHAAAALGVPTLVIFGITNPSRTRATGARVWLIGGGEDRDVKLDTPAAREAARTALAAISPETVAEAAAAIMWGGGGLATQAYLSTRS